MMTPDCGRAHTWRRTPTTAVQRDEQDIVGPRREAPGDRDVRSRQLPLIAKLGVSRRDLHLLYYVLEFQTLDALKVDFVPGSEAQVVECRALIDRLVWRG